MATFSYTATDTGVTTTDNVVLRNTHPISDTGVTNTESLVTFRAFIRTFNEYGLNYYYGDAFVVKAIRLVTTTGLVIGDSIRADIGVVRYNNKQFSNLELARNWSVSFTAEEGWSLISDRNYTIEVVT